jgi:hypothetical protein
MNFGGDFGRVGHDEGVIDQIHLGHRASMPAGRRRRADGETEHDRRMERVAALRALRPEAYGHLDPSVHVELENYLAERAAAAGLHARREVVSPVPHPAPVASHGYPLVGPPTEEATSARAQRPGNRRDCSDRQPD